MSAETEPKPKLRNRLSRRKVIASGLAGLLMGLPACGATVGASSKGPNGGGGTETTGVFPSTTTPPQTTKETTTSSTDTTTTTVDQITNPRGYRELVPKLGELCSTMSSPCVMGISDGPSLGTYINYTNGKLSGNAYWPRSSNNRQAGDPVIIYCYTANGEVVPSTTNAGSDSSGIWYKVLTQLQFVLYNQFKEVLYNPNYSSFHPVDYGTGVFVVAFDPVEYFGTNSPAPGVQNCDHAAPLTPAA